MGELRKQVKTAIVEAVQSDLEKYFAFESYQTDVADYEFVFNGLRAHEDEFEAEINGDHVLIKVWWGDASLDSNLHFTLFDVAADLYQYDKEENETKTEYQWQQFTG